MKHVATLLALGIAMLLTGCFASDRPMFAPESAVRPLEAGRYALYEPGDDKPSEFMELRLNGNVYDFINEKGAVNPVTFHPIPDGLHIAQVGEVPQRATDKKGYAYAVFKISGREALVYVLDCDQQDKAALTALGVEIRDKYECYIDKVADPAALLAGLKRSDRPSKMVRE